MGVPGSSTGDLFWEWAELPIPREQFKQELKAQQRLHFPECSPLPGVRTLLLNLKSAQNKDGNKVYVALATSSDKDNFKMKSSHPSTSEIFKVFDENLRVLGDDPRLAKGMGKPAPDIFLLALMMINESLPEGEEKITPKECLVFEDSVIGVEAGRRAKMRVVWVPHPGLAAEIIGRESEVLAGRAGLISIGNESQLGEIDDGWAVQLADLQNFPYDEFGSRVES
jgi:pseudouridine-5'-monophosphatase